MTVRIRSALDTLPAYAPGRSVPGAIKLASNELAFPTLPAVAQAIADAAVHEPNVLAVDRHNCPAARGVLHPAHPGWPAVAEQSL